MPTPGAVLPPAFWPARPSLDEGDGHRIAWRITQAGEIRARVDCCEPAEASCRRDTGPGCTYIEWVERQGSWEESYAGPDGPLYDGQILFTWPEGNYGYVWYYADDDAERWARHFHERWARHFHETWTRR